MPTAANKSRIPLIALVVSAISAAIAGAALYQSSSKDAHADNKNSTRDWQKGAIFSVMLKAGGPLKIEEIRSKYINDAAPVRDRLQLKDSNFSQEEIYSILLDLIGGGSVKLRDSVYFSVKTDDESVQDRRLALYMLEFALENEYRYEFDEFSSQFANWMQKNKAYIISKDRALSVLAVSIQSNIVGLAAKPGFQIRCMGEIIPLYVASSFRARSNAPSIMPMLNQLPPCPSRN